MFDVHLVQINNTPPDYDVPLDLPKEVTASGSQKCPFPISKGDIVTIQYLGKLPDGSIFDNGTLNPLTFVVGSGQILAGIDEGIVSFCKNNVVSLEIPPNKAFGSKWEGPVPQWSYVYYNVTVTSHIIRQIIEDGSPDLNCEEVVTPPGCQDAPYHVTAGDYVKIYYRVLNRGYQLLGEGEMRYPVGRKLIVPGWDDMLVGSCIGQHKSCWIPSKLAHKKGTSLFLALPEKGFFCEIKVIDLLLSKDNKDAIDFSSVQKSKDLEIPISDPKLESMKKYEL